MDISEFSKAVGVSPTTVSHALSGKRPVNSDTKNLIVRKMNELGYTPNANGQRLVKGHTHLVALDFVDSYGLEDPYVMQMVRAIYSQLRTRGYGLMLGMTAEASHDDALIERVMSHSVDGSIIIGGGRLSSSKLTNLGQAWAPCVVIDNVPVTRHKHINYVINNSSPAIVDMVDMAVRLGHRKMAFIGRKPDEPVHAAFKNAVESHGISMGERDQVFVGPQVSDGFAALMSLMNDSEPPTFVFVLTDSLAYGAIEAAQKLGLRIPEDISIAGHDDLPGIQSVYPNLTSIKMDCKALGTAAVDLLFDLRDNQDAPNVPVIIEPKLIVRATLASAPGRSPD